MIASRNVRRSLIMLGVVLSVVAFGLSGCFSISSAISGAMAHQPAADSGSSAAQPAAPADQPTQATPGSAATYQYQFNAFYGAMWNLGWFGYKDGNYQPGQGTIWEITSSSKGSKAPTTFERAYLKLNNDKSQWWRLRIKGSKEKEEIVYEILFGSDTVAQKVRYKDQGSGQIGEFVPDQSGSQPGALSQPTRDQMAKSLVGTETVQVRAGSFTADHYAYTDPKSGYKADSWISKKVPGSMVKFVGTNPQNNATSNGELVRIETGVSTVLESF
jgi:hypothetical protein